MTWRNAAKCWRIIVFFLAPIICLPIPLVSGTKVAGAAYVLIVSIIYFITIPIPLWMSMLICLVLYPLLGVHTAEQVARWSFNDAMLMLIGNLIFGMAIEGSNLHIRMALKTLLLLGPRPERLLLAFIAVSFFLSMWIANIGVVVMMLPIAFAIKKELVAVQGEGGDKHLTAAATDSSTTVIDGTTTGIVLAVVYGATIGGMATIVGSQPTLMFKLLTDQMYGDRTNINFGSFMVLCTPMAFCATVFTWLFMTLIYAPGFVNQLWKKKKRITVSNQQTDSEDRLMESLRGQYEKLGSPSFGEGSVIVFFVLLVLLWFFRSPPGFAGWGVLFPKRHVSDATVVMALSLVLFIWPTDLKMIWREGKNIPVVQWRPHMTERFPWELIFYTMGSNVLAAGSVAAGLTDAIAIMIQPLDAMPPWALVIVISLFITTITEFLGNQLIVVVSLPILGKLAERSLVNPIYYMLPAASCSVLAFMTPVSSNIMALVHGTGIVSIRQLCRTGIIPKVVCVFIIVFFMNTVGHSVYGVHTFPDWAANATGSINL
ncbi:Solute carrier family 13 member 3 [Hypsibius exemplaris]|uniref:Solute carrier family 13 member 3 n=1 Tax=Hypsibius exemplaris TaxID=2072580 RepID=A0A1W0X8B6_HYPEX|nr:Solute carrier family 13 member 3 [Hypsibius exemplaris]